MRSASAAVICALALVSCAPDRVDNDTLCHAYLNRASHVEVVAGGTVLRLLGTRGESASPHEGFLLRVTTPCDAILRVETNVAFTGTIPVQRGQRVVVKGEYETDATGGVIHWTHRDPRGHHPDGFIDVGGHRYN